MCFEAVSYDLRHVPANVTHAIVTVTDNSYEGWKTNFADASDRSSLTHKAMITIQPVSFADSC